MTWWQIALWISGGTAGYMFCAGVTAGILLRDPGFQGEDNSDWLLFGSLLWPLMLVLFLPTAFGAGLIPGTKERAKESLGPVTPAEPASASGPPE